MARRKAGKILHLERSPKQGEFLRSDAQFTLFCAGVGAGKTYAGAMWVVREICRCDGVGLIGANTYPQLTRVTLRATLGMLDRIGLPYCFGVRPPRSWGKSSFPKHDNILSVKVKNSIRHVVCMQFHNYDFIRGIEIAWFWMDESRDTKDDAFNVLMGRLRGTGLNAERHGIVTTTPNGFNWLYDKFVSNGPQALSDRRVVTATSGDNPWLPPGYVDMLRKNYSPRLAKQEIGGQFVPLTEGQAYAEFVRATHVSDEFEYDPLEPLIHSWDFNVNPMCSEVIQVDRSTGVVHVIDEIHIEGSARTRDATGEFITRYRDHKGPVRVYGDCSGGSKHTSSDYTDFQIIRDEYSRVFGDRARMCIQYATNPIVSDSVQDVNSMLCNAMGTVRLKVNPKCEYTIRDLEQVTFKPGSREIDKSDATLTHHSDALRYYISPVWPAKSKRVASGQMAGW